MPDPIPALLATRDAALQSFVTAVEALGAAYERIAALDERIKSAGGRSRLPMPHVQLQQQLQACLFAHLPGVVPSNACSRPKAAFDRARWLRVVQSPVSGGGHA